LMQVLGDDVSMLDAFKAANNVLHGAVGGIAEVINCPGLVNVDFADVRTVMSEMGMAMMGSAQASGDNRARIAAEQAVASPLLEDVNLAGARGVLVNITASSTVKMREIHEVMNTIKSFTAEEATVIVGQVLDDSMEDALRVTMVATGLGSPVARQHPKPMQIIRTGTDDAPMMVGNSEEVPSVMTNRRSRTVQAMSDSGIDTLDIPAFLRRQAD
ncbi:MAG TPA: cell division protein FtsZ, partial [Azonexus sp.]|nr:cell division protein FtsZ [Azonexus sp.]